MRGSEGAARFLEMSRKQGLLETVDVRFSLTDNRIAGLVFGHFDQNLTHLEQRLGIQAVANGNQVILKGPPEKAEQARFVLEKMNERVRAGLSIQKGDIDGAIEEAAAKDRCFPVVRP